MDFTYYYEFDGRYSKDPIPDKVKIDIAKERAAHALAEKFINEALVQITPTGAVKVLIRT